MQLDLIYLLKIRGCGYMNETLEQNTAEEFEAKYNLIFENPVTSDENNSNTTNQILNTNSEDNENIENEDDVLAQERAEECTALVTVKERRLMAAQTMFKKSIKISIKSFLISLSLSFLNLFI